MSARRLAGAALRIVTGALVLAAALLGLGWLGLQRVPPAHVGVRQARWGGGIAARDFAPGVHASLRPLNVWYTLDARTRVVAFAHRSDGGSEPMLHVRTKDGNVARVAVSVPYRIRAGEAHRLVQKGLRTSYHDLVRETVKKLLLVELAHLSSDDFASTDLRAARVAQTLPVLNEHLAAYHVEAESIELRMVFFPPEYEGALQRRQLGRQLALLAEAEAELKEEERAVARLEQELGAAVEELRAEGKQGLAELVARHKAELAPLQAEAATVRETRAAEAEAEHARLMAEGDRAFEEARAERTRLLAEAYAAPGGRLLLARDAARNLRIEEVTLDSSDPRVPSPLELDALVRRLVGEPP